MLRLRPLRQGNQPLPPCRGGKLSGRWILSWKRLRRAWRIIVKKDYSEVALKRGEPPENPKKYAPFTAATNLIGGLAMGYTVLAVIIYLAFGAMILPVAPETMFREIFWLKFAGSILWMKIFTDFIISRQARPFKFKKRAKKAK